MATLKMYRQEMHPLSKKEVLESWRDLLKDLKGNAFFSWKPWPRDMQAVFWKKPMRDTETFQLALFFVGNGFAPLLFTKWILLAQYWAESPQKSRKKSPANRLCSQQCGQSKQQMVLFQHQLQQALSSERKTKTVNENWSYQTTECPRNHNKLDTN